jgi:signal transduction histidine kinase
VTRRGLETDGFIESVAAGIAHEVRNPLNALQINLRILEHELAPVLPDRDAHAYQVLRTIASELSSLDHFVCEFLRYARPPQLRLERIALPDVLADLATFIKPECDRKQVQLQIEASPALPPVVADRFQLKHALLNLVLNSLRATPRQGTITMTAVVDGGRARLSVKDSGEGIAEDQLARVFELFFSTSEGGTGLGLPIARRIVEAHGGTLVLTSSVGLGTTATIELPIAAPPD